MYIVSVASGKEDITSHRAGMTEKHQVMSPQIH